MATAKKDNAVETFSAIKTFVDDLHSVFSNNKAFSLYHRLLQHVKPEDTEAMRKFIIGFDVFLRIYDTNLIDDKLKTLPQNTQIAYGTNKKIYIDISYFCNKADDDTLAVIRSHLLTISAILIPKDTKFDELSKIPFAAAAAAAAGGDKSFLSGIPVDTTTSEGRFVASIVSKARGTMEGLDPSNPTQAMVGLLQGGVIQDMIGGINSGLENGSLDIKKMVGSLQGAMNSLIPSNDETKPNNDKKKAETVA